MAVAKEFWVVDEHEIQVARPVDEVELQEGGDGSVVAHVAWHHLVALLAEEHLLHPVHEMASRLRTEHIEHHEHHEKSE